MDLEFYRAKAHTLDTTDSLALLRKQFLFPRHNNREVVYFTGNSLGLQPITTRQALLQELDDWATYGVEGHFKARHPWYSYHEMFAHPMAAIVGAMPEEVVVMNGLTTNLHLLMATFYRPTRERFKILCEAKAFPSDRYALESRVRLAGYHPDNALFEIAPREGEQIIRETDLLQAIENHGPQLALVVLGGVNYYTGQLFDIQNITQAAHKAGAMCGWDLAHAAGNVPLYLHDHEVDFAAWCTYKYLNAGPGSAAGAFVHIKHAKDTSLLRMAGWWGHDKNVRFKMEKDFKAMPTAEGWQLSNAPVLAMTPLKASLELFEQAGGMSVLHSKSVALTGFLEEGITAISAHKGVHLEIITPTDTRQRGAQLSMLVHGADGHALFKYLTEKGVMADWREPNVIRMAPVPLYNNFMDICLFFEILNSALETPKTGSNGQ